MQWRDRLIYLGMSLLVGWHTLAIIVAPAPDGSATVQALRRLVQPYISVFRLDTTWNFFAPVGRHSQFRYAIEDARGNNHIFIPTEEASASLPNYAMWREFKYLYEGIMETPPTRSAGVAAMLCRKHAALDPVSVILFEAQEQDFSPEDRLRGQQPLDPEFVIVNPLAQVACGDHPLTPRRTTIRPLRRP
jgi:hypothetical protein